MRIPHGTAPSSPVNGDIWTTTAGIYVRINGGTVGPLGAAGGSYVDTTTNQSVGGVKTFTDNPVVNTGSNAGDITVGRLWLGDAGGTPSTYNGPTLTGAGITAGSDGLLRVWTHNGTTATLVLSSDGSANTNWAQLNGLAGFALVNGFGGQGTFNVTTAGLLTHRPVGDTLPVAIRRGTDSSPTSDLTEWQTAANAQLSAIDVNGKFIGPTAASATASINLPPGSAPSSPANGDLWTTSADLFARINGSTRTVARTEDVQVFTSSGTWTKPTNGTPLSTRVFVIGGGGGGGSGRCGATGSARGGGGGGGGGGWSFTEFRTSDLSSTETVTVGGTAAGGTSVNTANNGNTGTAGNLSSFGTTVRIRAGGGSAGGGGTNGGAGAGGGGGGGTVFGISGGAGSNGTAAATAGAGAGQASGGGGGGGLSTGNALLAAASGGTPNTIATSGASGTGASALSGQPSGGGGGGGGAASIAGAATAGSNGGNYGGGGGGGGASVTGQNSGAGGVGAAGLVVVITTF